MRVVSVTPQGVYIVRLVRNENAYQSLVNFCTEKGIRNAMFSAIGAVKNVRLGYYDLSTKEYDSREYAEDHEVASMIGNIAMVDGKPFVHAHAVLSRAQRERMNECIGGHVFDATVAVTLEVYLTAFKEPLTRSFDEATGLKLLDCGAQI